MRMYQHHGLTQVAEDYLDEHVAMVPKLVCPECGAAVTETRKIFGEEQVDVFYGDGPILHTYEGKNGRIIKEVVQAISWSSGPCGFLCLELEDGTKIGEWSEEAIRNA
jgi:hypothetical protein